MVDSVSVAMRRTLLTIIIIIMLATGFRCLTVLVCLDHALPQSPLDWIESPGRANATYTTISRVVRLVRRLAFKS